MFISRNWLNQFVEVSDLPVEKLEDLITTKVAEVEEVTEEGNCLSGARVVEVLEVSAHPERPKLSLAKVSDGNSQFKVVCGAKNIRAGMLTAHLAPGSSFPSGQTVSERDFAGFVSQGVLVSESELEVGSDNDGIIDFGSDLFSAENPEPGQGLDEIYGSPDVLFEIDNKSLTHRPDLWGHFGFAREVSSILGRDLKCSLDKELNSAGNIGDFFQKQFGAETEGPSKTYSVSLDAKEGCSRFTLTGINRVQAKPSPAWLRRRLHVLGVGVRNQLVDLSNYVMLETGQPNHAYDSDKLSGSQVVVRNAFSGEKLKALDGSDLELSPDDTLIADESGGVALAGIIGGEDSSVSELTNSILFESGNFDAAKTRVSSKSHGIRTEASNRFEKSLSFSQVPLASLRYLSHLKDLQPEAQVFSFVDENTNEASTLSEITLPKGLIQERLGANLPEAEVVTVLESLGFSLEDRGESYLVLVPAFRAGKDVGIPEDLVEEVGRIIGYESIPSVPPEFVCDVAVPSFCGVGFSNYGELLKIEEHAAHGLTGLGFYQIDRHSFFDAKEAEALGVLSEPAVELKNPVDADLAHLRTSLVPGLLLAAKENQSSSDIRLFEFGRTYHKTPAGQSPSEEKGTGSYEIRKLGLVLGQSDCSGSKAGDLSNGAMPSQSCFFKLAGVFKSLFGAEKTELKPTSASVAWMHPHRAADVFVEGVLVGVIAEVNPAVASRYQASSGAKNRLALAEINLSKLSENVIKAEFVATARGKFPSSFFELSIVAPNREYFSTIEEFFLKDADERIKRLELLDIYQGKPLDETEKSVSVKFTLGADNRTLGSEEVEEIQAALMDRVQAGPYSLRT